jgi:hypothetical protein
VRETISTGSDAPRGLGVPAPSANIESCFDGTALRRRAIAVAHRLESHWAFPFAARSLDVGDIRPETGGTAHWWQNLGNKTVVLFVGDVLHDKNDKHM